MNRKLFKTSSEKIKIIRVYLRKIRLNFILFTRDKLYKNIGKWKVKE